MERLGRFTTRHRRPILVLAGVALVLSGLGSAGVIDRLSTGGIEAPDSESVRALETLEQTFGVGRIDLVLLVTARSGDVDDRAAARDGRRLTRRLAAEPGVEEAFSYWTTRLPPLRGQNGDKALILARLAGTRDEVTRRLDDIVPRYESSSDVLDVRATGFGAVFREVGQQMERDLRRAERIVVPLTLLLLLIVFRSAVAAVLPLAVGGLAIVGTLLLLRVLASFTEVSIFAISITTALSLGLGIDYSLFIVSRFREELAAGRAPDEAVVRTVATAGRTVAFSAVTVAASLVALLVFPLAFLRSFGFAGIGVVAIAGIASVVVLPALLATIGTRVDRWSIRKPVRATGAGGWHRLAMTVMRRPVPIAAAATTVLVLLGLPFLRIELGAPDPRVLPPGSPARATVDDLTANFSSGEAFPTFVLVRDAGRLRRGDVHRYAAAMSAVPGVARVDAWTGSYAQGARLFAGGSSADAFVRDDSTYLRLVPAPSIQPFSPRAERLLSDVRAVPAPFGVELAGQTAEFFDGKRALFQRLPLALAIIGVTTFVVLFLAFGSVLVPVKAIVLNLLSLTAAFGAMVWVFQDGHFAGVLGFTPREAIDVFNPILMFAIAFGISMDYEVFLLSRIREEYDRTGDNAASVAAGLERTGRLITAAALLLVIVFLARLASGVSIIKMYGLGMALAILVDAFIVRTALVPAFMRLAGRLNWWLPRPMQPLYERWGHRVPAEPDEVIVLDVAPATDGQRPGARRSRSRSGL